MNLVRAVGAAWRDLHSRSRAQGSSTLTMQLARNLFLSNEKTYGRKLQEILLSMQIERVFTKDQIFQMYANQIYLGHGTYGFEAASEYYFSKHVEDLTLPEAALLAALPKGAEYYSPVNHPERALRRRNLVLSEMLADRKITPRAGGGGRGDAAGAEDRAAAELGCAVLCGGGAAAAGEGVWRGRGAGRGVEGVYDARPRPADWWPTRRCWTGRRRTSGGMDGRDICRMCGGGDGSGDVSSIRTGPGDIEQGGYYHALVTEVAPERVMVKIGPQRAVMTPADWAWTQKTARRQLSEGRGRGVCAAGRELGGRDACTRELEQDSGAQASLMAVDNSNGEVLAMVGGRDFALSQFNRATQSEREVGSSFKPYVYTTAVEAGAKPTDMIVDGPVSFSTPNGPYTPHNYEGDYKGDDDAAECVCRVAQHSGAEAGGQGGDSAR